MKKIIVIGCPGSGKSTFSKVLHKITGIPLFHLDMMYWNSDKTTVEKSVFCERLSKTIQKSEWIIDGNYGSTMELRIQACDTIIFLDYPLDVCLDGIKERRGKARSDMPWIETSDEEDTEFIEFIKNYNSQSRPIVMELLEKYSYKNIYVFKNRAEADEFLTLEKRMKPIWETDIVWEESLTMVKDKNGIAKAPFLYMPKQIFSVTNAAGTIVYEENRDWVWNEGQFCLTPDSRIFSFEFNELYPKNEIPGHCFPTPEGYILFEEGHFFHDRQIAVSYTCEKGEWTGINPAFSADKLPRTTARLKKGEPLRVVLYGDSISEGYNASGYTGAEPYLPCYGELLCQELTRRTGAQIEFINSSKAGMNSVWGADNVEELVNCHDVDLLIVAFGMNDGGKTPEDFVGNIRRLVKGALAKQKEMEVILVATSTPNPMLTDDRAKFWGNQILFKSALDRLAEELSNEVGIAVADITGMQSFLHSRKRFVDTTGNHVNHPNDFFHRCYAQFLLGMLLED